MSTRLLLGRDDGGYVVRDASQFPTDIYTATLAAGASETLTVPSNFPVFIMYVRLQPTGWCWCSRGGTAAVPAGGTLAAAVSELICGAIEYKRIVYAADVLKFITANTTCDIEVAFFATGYQHQV